MILRKNKQFTNISQAREAYKDGSPKAGIYCFESKRRKVVYVGMTENFFKRFSGHKKSYHSKRREHKRLHEFFDIVGFNRTPVKILFEAEPERLTRQELYIIESILVEIYFHKGYKILNSATGQDLAKYYYRGIGIKKYSRNGNLIEGYKSIYDLTAIYGFDVLNILRCCKCEIKLSNGYRWLAYHVINDPSYFDFLQKVNVHPLKMAESIYRKVVRGK